MSYNSSICFTIKNYIMVSQDHLIWDHPYFRQGWFGCENVLELGIEVSCENQLDYLASPKKRSTGQ